MSPGHLVSFLDKTFCMEPILHCILNHQESNLGLLITSLYGNIKISFDSKFAHNSCLGWGAMGIDLESHVTEIETWIMIALGHF